MVQRDTAGRGEECYSDAATKAMTYPYDAIFEGKTVKIFGVDDAGRYVLDGGERLELKSPDPKGLPIRSRPLRRVAKLRFDGEKWFLDGESAKACCVQAQKKRRANSEAHSESQSMLELMEKLDEIAFADRWHMVGVAWFDESAATVEGETVEDCEQRRSFLETRGGCGTINPLPPADCFLPFFLTDFGIISQQRASDGHRGRSEPDWFTSISAAAEYAGKCKQTILNWKKRSWLTVEQQGRKVRIAKADLDKCIRKQ